MKPKEQEQYYSQVKGNEYLKTQSWNNEPEDKPLKQAAALRYDSDKDAAPILIARGSGYIAENIIKKASENQVPIVENLTLSEVLNTMELGSEIPPELYQVAAEILAFVSNLDNKYKKFDGCCND